MINSGAVRQLLGAATTVLIGAGIAWAGPPARVTACDSDTGAGFNLAQALAAGGEIQFSCPAGTTIRVTGRYVLKQNTIIDGGDAVTLDGHGSFGPMLTSSQNIISATNHRAWLRAKTTPAAVPGRRSNKHPRQDTWVGPRCLRGR